MVKRKKILRIDKNEADVLEPKYRRVAVYLNDIWKPNVLIKRLTAVQLIEYRLGFSNSVAQPATEPQQAISTNDESSPSSTRDKNNRKYDASDSPGSTIERDSVDSDSSSDEENMEFDEDNKSQCSLDSLDRMAFDSDTEDIIPEFRINKTADLVPVYNDCKCHIFDCDIIHFCHKFD